VGVSPTPQPLEPEATGAVMEVTKWLKPGLRVTIYGDSASVQAVTRVNGEQASKRTMRRSFWPRADHFRSSPMSGHFQIPSACLKRVESRCDAVALGSNISVAAPFVRRCLTGSTVAPFSHPAHR
jgi:hypothetical protein